MSNLEKHLITREESKLLATEYEKSNYTAINEKRPAKKPDSKSEINPVLNRFRFFKIAQFY